MPILFSGQELETLTTQATESSTSVTFGQPGDTIATFVLVGILAVIVLIAVIRKSISNKKMDSVSVEEIPAETVEAPTAPGSAGQLKLHNVEPKTAAMVMAIVADKLGKPLNELKFISIKEVE